MGGACKLVFSKSFLSLSAILLARLEGKKGEAEDTVRRIVKMVSGKDKRRAD